jgi:hypothetical protein
MNALINHKLKAICILIPKNASSYIKKILCTFYEFQVIKIARDDFYSFCEFKNTNLDCFYNNSHFEPSVQIHYLRSKGIVRYYESLPQNNNFDKNVWNSYYKFSFVRNPYNKFLSSFLFYEQNNKKYKSFKFKNMEEMINAYYNQPNIISDLVFSHTFITQYDHLVSLNKYINLDFIGKIENLNDDLHTVLTLLFSKVNSKYNKCSYEIEKNETIKNDSDSELLTPNTLLFINNHFDNDFNSFKYKKIVIS